MATRDELITAVSERYGGASREDRGRILDEFAAVTGLHRKHAVRLLRGGAPDRRCGPRPGRRVYDVAVRKALHAIVGVDLTQIHGLGPYLALKLVGECGTDLSAWPSAKHSTSWLGLAPHNMISGGKVLSSKTRRTGNRAASLLRLAAVTVGRTDTALGAFHRRLSTRAGKSKAITARARKIAVLFYNTLRHGMSYADPGASYYEERYRQRVLSNLRRRAKSMGLTLHPTAEDPAQAGVS